MSQNENLFFKQVFDEETSTYTYFLADRSTGQSIVIDPVLGQAQRDLEIIKSNNFKLKYIIETHVHADHITGAALLKKSTNAQIVLSSKSESKFADILAKDDQSFEYENFQFKTLHTPGHTHTCSSIYSEGMVFTGDTLLINGCGRTDFQSGSSEQLYDSITQKLFTLPEETKVYPGHDYNKKTQSTIKVEQETNSRIGNKKSKEDFVKTMEDLNLDPPKKIEESVPANMKCGLQFEEVQNTERGIREISTQDTFKNKEAFTLVDVRRADEWSGELNHIPDTKLITLGEDLTKFLKESPTHGNYIFVCRSGNRSGTAALEAQSLGFKHVFNMIGGMIQWNQESLPTQTSKD